MSNPSKARRKPGSLVWKLTFRQVFSLIRILVFLDAVIVVILLGTAFSRCESEGYAAYRERRSLELPAQAGDFGITLADTVPDGVFTLSLHSSVDRQLAGRYSRHVDGTLRVVGYTAWGDNWYQSLDYARYTVAYPLEEGGYLLVACDLGRWISVFKSFFQPFLILQAVVVFFHMTGTRRAVKRDLKPIEELTALTRSMSTAERTLTGGLRPGEAPHAAPVHVSEPFPPGATIPKQEHKKKKGTRGPGKRAMSGANVQPKLKLDGAIHTLNTINEDHLDMRISISDEREELRGLARAINNMLDRLNAAYQSQLRFVSDASHELRTPIAVIQGYANLLDRWGKTDEKTLQESIDAIKAEASGMQDLVEQLLFLARSDNNSIVLSPEDVDVSALAREVLRDAQVIDDAHLFQIKVEEGLTVWGDVQLLKQAMRILMDNAIKYTPAGERIQIAVQNRGESVEISVTDHGIGIPDEDISQVFERFFRADESRARQSGGTGLGLSIAKWIIDRHGGHVEVLSRQDLGTRMSYHLPKPQTREQIDADRPAV